MRRVLCAATAVAGLFAATDVFAAPVVTLTSTPTVVGDSVTVSAHITSAFVISSATATIGAVSSPLTGSGADWSGVLDIHALGLGPLTLTVSATDAAPSTGSATLALAHDHAPTVTWNVLDESVARPTIHVTASCSDSDPYPCSSITLKTGTTTLATGTTSIDQTVSLAASDGQAIILGVIAQDSVGLTSARTARIYVDDSPRLVLVNEGAGRIFDFDATRVLYQAAADGNFAILNRSTNAVTELGAGSEIGTTNPAETAYLTADGAVWQTAQWRNGSLETITTPTAEELVFAKFRARGSWAAWSASSDKSIHRRNLATGVNEIVATSSLMSVPLAVDVDENGTVVFTAPETLGNGGAEAVFMKDASGLRLLTPDPGPRVGSTVMIESGNVAFNHWGLASDVLDLWTPAGIEPLEPTVDTNGVLPPNNYLMNAGWIAYTKANGFMLEAWKRSPAGVAAIASPLADVTKIAGLGEDGEVMVDTRGAASGRYLGSLFIGSTNGRAVHRDGNWYVVMGRDLFRVETGELPEPLDGGADDSGAPTPTGDDEAASGTSAPPSSIPPGAADAGAIPIGGGDTSESGCSTTSEKANGVAAPAFLLLAMLAGRRRAFMKRS